MLPQGKRIRVAAAAKATAMDAANATGFKSVKRLSPDAFIAVSSLSELNRPKAASTAMRKDIGIVYIRNDGMTDRTNCRRYATPTP